MGKKIVSFLFLTILFLLPFERIGSFALNANTGHPVIRLSQLAVILFLGMCFYLFISKQYTYKKIPGMVWLVCMLVPATIAAIKINYFQVWWEYLVFISLILLFYFTAYRFYKLKDIMQVHKIIYLSVGIVCVFGLYQYIGNIIGLPNTITGLRPQYAKEILGFPRIHSTAIEPLYFANFLLLPLLLGFSLLLYKIKQTKWQIFILFLAISNFFLTMSRGAFIAIAIGICFIFFSYIILEKNIKSLSIPYKKLLIGFSVLICSLFIVSSISSYLSNRNLLSGPREFFSLTTIKIFQTESYFDRVKTQKDALATFRQSPIFGVGIGGYSSSINNYPPARSPNDVATSNNQVLELLAEGGIIGFLFYVGFILSLLYYGLKTVKKYQDPYLKAWVLSLIGFAIAVWIQYLSFTGFFIIYIWIFFGMLGGLASYRYSNKTKQF